MKLITRNEGITQFVKDQQFFLTFDGYVDPETLETNQALTDKLDQRLKKKTNFSLNSISDCYFHDNFFIHIQNDHGYYHLVIIDWKSKNVLLKLSHYGRSPIIIHSTTDYIYFTRGIFIYGLPISVLTQIQSKNVPELHEFTPIFHTRDNDLNIPWNQTKISQKLQLKRVVLEEHHVIDFITTYNSKLYASCNGNVYAITPDLSEAHFQGDFLSGMNYLQVQKNNLCALKKPNLVYLFDFEGNQIASQILNHKNMINALNYQDDIIVSGGYDPVIKVTNIRTGEELTTIDFSSFITEQSQRRVVHQLFREKDIIYAFIGGECPPHTFRWDLEGII